MYARFEQALAGAVAKGRIAGAVALVADHDGVTYEHAAGVRTVGQPEPMDAQTIFWIASMTKAIVSVAALQLVEQGRLSLDGDLIGLLPDLAGLQVLEGVDPDGMPRLRPAKGEVSLRHLLTHTSGFGYPFTSEALAAYAQTPGALDPNSGARAALKQPLLFDPGTGFVYGIGIDWAGVAVEAASGQKLDAYLSEYIFRPLGMNDTGFALKPEQQARKAGVHVRGPDGGLIPIPFGLPADPEVLSGGGGLYSTIRDYGRFMRMLLGRGELDGTTILSSRTVASLAESHTGPHRTVLRSAMANMSNDFDPYPDMQTGHGLATMVIPQLTAEGRNAGSLSWAGLANTYYWVDPAAGKAGVIMAQLLPFADPEVLALLAALERDAYEIA